MTIAQDFLLDDDGDLKIDATTMDFVIGKSDQQHALDILQSVPGWWKEFPLAGLNPYQFFNSKTSKSAIDQAAKIALTGDGFINVDVDLDFDASGTIKINLLDYSRP